MVAYIKVEGCDCNVIVFRYFGQALATPRSFLTPMGGHPAAVKGIRSLVLLGIYYLLSGEVYGGLSVVCDDRF